jgi:hypothetical protein
MGNFRGAARLNFGILAAAALLQVLPPGAARAQQFTNGSQVNVLEFGSSSSGGTNAGNANDINISVSNNNIPFSNCTAQFISGCVGALTAGGDASGSGNGGSGGQIMIQVAPLIIGTTDPTAQITTYNSGILAESLGGWSTQHPGNPGVGGNVAITSAATIAVNLGDNISPSVTSPLYVNIARQAGVDNYSDFAFGGGILALSNGAYGVTDNTSGISGDVTGAAAGSVNVVDTGTITTGAYTGAGSQVPQGVGSTNAGIMALSIGGDSAASDDHGWIALGQGGAAGNVTVSGPPNGAPADISTVADLSPGIFALSQGGGGSTGSHDIAGGAGGQVTVNANFNIATTGNQSSGIIAVSTGGNLIGVEQQGISGPGGPVNVNVSAGAAVDTSGVFSPAVVAASFAGGLTTSQSQIKDFSTTGGTSGSVSIAVGYDGMVTASGDGSDGLVAQSIGGGGGTPRRMTIPAITRWDLPAVIAAAPAA